jgi:hypothetical protein
VSPRVFAFVSMIVFASACGTGKGAQAKTSAELVNNYGYHPIDPLPVEVFAPPGVNVTSQAILNALPDETMRLAIGELTGDGSIAYGPAKAGYKGRSYLVVLDYIKFDTRSFEVIVPRATTGEAQLEALTIAPLGTAAAPKVNTEVTLVPTYVGVGLRLTANVTVNEGSVDLGNLVALGAAAKAKKVSGTLVVQTLGISGDSISSLIPVPSDISDSTIQSAILSLGAIKAKMYEADTRISPRVLGIYNNLGGGQRGIATFISAVLRQRPKLAIQP